MSIDKGLTSDKFFNNNNNINMPDDHQYNEAALRLTEEDYKKKIETKEELIQELLNKVNALVLDKNRLRQRLTQKNQQRQQSTRYSTNGVINSGSMHSSASLSSNENENIMLNNSIDSPQQSSTSSLSDINNPVIDGIECATSCEEDMVSLLNLYKKRLSEYQNVTEYVSSKCIAFHQELIALQKHYGYAQQEIVDLRHQLEVKSEECVDIKSELQTVVLNYESQLSTMSEHVSCLTDKVASQSDEIERSRLISKVK